MSGNRGKARISTQEWEALYREYFPKLGGYFAYNGLNPAQAEDLTHDVFQELGRANVPENPNAYIYGIARNILSQQRRREIAERAALGEYSRRLTSDDRCIGADTLDTRLSEGAEIGAAERILNMVAPRLPARDRELTTLRFLEGLPVKQVARRLNCSENAVRKCLRKVKAVMRRLYAE
ncbi:MAG: sigma-70 family RNA polymerase sigma factor [Planctomycetes bacterium]|nr:sigma-70 family RNA polymerase sigma factor [Planctomycetota bacterium]